MRDIFLLSGGYGISLFVTEPTIKNTENNCKPQPTFVFSKAHTLVAVDEVSAGGSVLAGCREAFIIFLLTVKAVVT